MASRPRAWWNQDRRAVYTFPDQTDNLMYLVNGRASFKLTDDLLLSGNAFYRYYKSTTQNGDAEVSCVDNDRGPGGFQCQRARFCPSACARGPPSAIFDPGGQPAHRRAGA